MLSTNLNPKNKEEICKEFCDLTKVAQVILDVLIQNNLSKKQSSEALNQVSATIWDITVLPNGTIPNSAKVKQLPLEPCCGTCQDN